MLSRYIEKAMRRSRFEWLPDDGLWYGEIPGLLGVWATGETEAATRVQLRETLEDWIAVGLATHSPLPVVDGIDLNIQRVSEVPAFGPVSRRELVRCLRRAGFDGRFAGGRHQYMTKPGRPPLQIPNPHQDDIGINLLSKLLAQAGISGAEWERL